MKRIGNDTELQGKIKYGDMEQHKKTVKRHSFLSFPFYSFLQTAS